MKLAAFLPVVLALAACKVSFPGQDPVGSSFPDVTGQALTGDVVGLLALDPDEGPRILLVGYEQRTQFDIDRWLLGLMQAETPATLIEVPTIPGLLPGLASGWIDDGMRGGIPPEDWASVVTLYGEGAKSVAKFTGNELPNNSRVLLLDPAGKVLWFHDRGYSAAKLLELDQAVRALPQPPMSFTGLPRANLGGSSTVETVFFDFTTPGKEGSWMVLDDRVMGGLSRTEPLSSSPQGATFTGNFTRESNGGFASLRSLPGEPMDLSQVEAIELLVRGDGRTYQLRLRDSVRLDGVSWSVEFQPRSGHWQVVRIPLAAFEATFRGRQVPNATPLKRSAIRTFGLMLAGGDEGAFRLDLRWIRGA